MKLFYSALLFCLCLTVAHAQPVLIDQVVALVEDDVITRKELIKEVKKIREDMSKKGRNVPASASLNRQVLELMITKSVILQTAKNRGVAITDTQLNNAMQNLAKQNNLNLSDFRQALLNSGIDYNDFREGIRKELTISSFGNSYARQNVEITDQEVDDFIKRSGSDAESIEYRLSHILVALPDGADSEQVNKAREKVLTLTQKLEQGDSFSQLATEFSDGNNALEGGDLGWRKLAETPSLFASQIQNMQVGQYSDPIRSASGFHIVQLVDKRDSEQVLVQQTHARHILIKTDELTTDEMAKEKLSSIREQILQGADFAELAKQHSDDTGSGGLGGDLGWFGSGVMVPAFEQALNRMQIGETSEIFRSQFGWHILQVIERRTQDETEESKRNKIREQLKEQKKTEVLELWQRRLRDQAFVKILDV